MNLSPQQIAKIDPNLAYELLYAQGNKILRVVMSLKRETTSVLSETITPDNFPDYTAYRQALITQQKKHLSQGMVGQTLQALKNLSLTVYGGELMSIVVVSGEINQIIKALDLSGVQSVTLDEVIYAEPIDPKIVEYLSNLILEIVPGNKDKIVKASQEYINDYYKRYGRLQVLGMGKPLTLDNIYTTVKVLPEYLIRNFRDFHGIREVFKQRQRFCYERENEKITGIDVANKYQFLTVLGAPGSGKSTLLRKVGLEAIKGKLNYQGIPIFIELKQFNSLQYIDLIDHIKNILKDCNFTKVDKLVNKGLEQGKFIFLLDGLDEVSYKIVNQVVERVIKLVDKYHKNRFIISCRTAAYQQQLDKFNTVIIAEFDHAQIKQFINQWFSSETDKRTETAKKCLQALEKNIGAKDLAKTPLLLTFICLVYDESQNLPRNKSKLYKKALEILLEKWWSEKRLEWHPIYKDFTTTSEIMLLSEIAYEGFIEDKLFFKTEELVEKIKTFLSKNLNASQDLDGEAILNAIAIQQGILVERLDNIYSFSHLTLQEYLTAKYVVDNGLIPETVKHYVTDTRWKEVFMLIAGLMERKNGADKLLLEMENKALSYLKSLSHNHRFLKLLEWAETKTINSSAELTPVAKRLVAIGHAIANTNTKGNPYTNPNADVNGYTNAYNNANAYTKAYTKAYTNGYVNAYDYTNDYAIRLFIKWIEKMEAVPPLFSGVNLQELREQLEQLKTKILNERQPIKFHQKFAQKIIETWLNAFDLSLDMINLSLAELKEIDENYFYICNLMLKCKDAAELVTNETWEGIEERMYRPVVLTG